MREHVRESGSMELFASGLHHVRDWMRGLSANREGLAATPLMREGLDAAVAPLMVRPRDGSGIRPLRELDAAVAGWKNWIAPRDGIGMRPHLAGGTGLILAALMVRPRDVGGRRPRAGRVAGGRTCTVPRV